MEHVPTSLAAALIAAFLLAPPALLGQATPLDAPEAYEFQSDAYGVRLEWGGGDLSDPVVRGVVSAAGRTADFEQQLRVTTTWGGASVRYAPTVTSAALAEEDGVPTLRLALRFTHAGATLHEASGSLVFSFLPDAILHESEVHVVGAAFAPTVESNATLAWSAPFGLHGSLAENGTIALDDGRSLDHLGKWQATGRKYGVFQSDAGGALVGHARVAQGDMANYLDDGRFRVDEDGSSALSWYNGFLDLSSMPQETWTRDAIVFLPDGSAPGALVDWLAAHGAFAPPHPGDLVGQGQVVIALADTGINPYHEDFRNPHITAHPSTYVRGYPASSEALPLTFGNDYAASRNADDEAVWSKVVQEKLYWIPGTKIIGAYSVGNAPGSLLGADSGFPARYVIDDNGHGTGVASVAAGYRHGACEECLIVVIEGTSAGVAWAAKQPWIDMISNSYGAVGSLPLGTDYRASKEAYQAGKSVLYSAGNGMSGTALAPDVNPSFTRATSGPAWVITVGAASPRNDQSHYWDGVPADVVSYGSGWPAAAPFSVTGEQTFSGTSCATPIVAGVEGAILLHARRLVGDVDEGPRPFRLSVVAPENATLPADGPLADGILTRNELEAVLMKTAIPMAFDPDTHAKDASVFPGTPASFVYDGYGLVNAKSREAGKRVVAGADPMPDRSEVDLWISTFDRVRTFWWGSA